MSSRYPATQAQNEPTITNKPERPLEPLLERGGVGWRGFDLVWSDIFMYFGIDGLSASSLYHFTHVASSGSAALYMLMPLLSLFSSLLTGSESLPCRKLHVVLLLAKHTLHQFVDAARSGSGARALMDRPSALPPSFLARLAICLAVSRPGRPRLCCASFGSCKPALPDHCAHTWTQESSGIMSKIPNKTPLTSTPSPHPSRPCTPAPD